ncbi:MAG: hypothetical protein J5777_02725 [Clostridiales bacterium]|nr:hypothetical protein [Clostridiales bacterium]
MWNRQPNINGRNDPFSNASKSKEWLSAESVKCPTCAANITYMPEVNGMMCRNCGNIYDAETMEVLGSFGTGGEHDYVGEQEISAEDRKRHEILCNSCGAQLIADENTMSTMCPFCGSPALITRRMTREFKPDYIIPFKIDKHQASKNMMEWISSRKYTPWGFKSKCRLTKMTALYVPFWLLDCHVNTEMTGTGKFDRGASKVVYEVNSKLTYYVKGVPFDGATKIANKLMEAIEPFDYSELVAFDNKYLQGFYADKYDKRPIDLADKMFSRLDSFSVAETDLIAKKYDEYEARPEKTFSWMSDVKTRYCLLPVWFMTVEFEDRQYQFAVNGQTGEASGQMPTTSATDKMDFFNEMVRSNWKWIPIITAVVIPFILSSVLFQGSFSVSRIKTFWILFLSALEIITIITIVLTFVGAFLSKHISKRIHKVADEVNDYDKDPGLDQYLDTTQKTSMKVEENYLGQFVKETSGNGPDIPDNIINTFVP